MFARSTPQSMNGALLWGMHGDYFRGAKKHKRTPAGKAGKVRSVRRWEKRYPEKAKAQKILSKERQRIANKLHVFAGDLPANGSQAWLDTLQAFESIRSLQREIRDMSDDRNES